MPAGRRTNVVVIILDDVGFGQIGCYGPSIGTPHMAALAAGGIRHSCFHTTALCSPTRAALLTGRNHRSNGMGSIPELVLGCPGYRKWERGTRRASGPAATLLRVIQKEPEAVWRALPSP